MITMVTEDDLQAAYDRAVALAGTKEGREAMAEYWGLAETRRDQCAQAREVTGPVQVPADALTEAILQDEIRQQAAKAALERAVQRLYQPPVHFSPEGLAY